MESTEQDIIDKIKGNKVQTVHELRHMCEFFEMDQEKDENSRQYGARLKAAAELCDFTIGSGEGKILFGNQMITGRLVAGPKNKDITREIIELAAVKKTKTSRLILLKVEELIQVKEQSREDVIQLKGKSKAGVHKMTNKITKTYVKDKRSTPYPRNGNSEAKERVGTMRQATTRPPGTVPCLGPGLFQMWKHWPPEGCVKNQGTRHKCQRNHGHKAERNAPLRRTTRTTAGFATAPIEQRHPSPRPLTKTTVRQSWRPP